MIKNLRDMTMDELAVRFGGMREKDNFLPDLSDWRAMQQQDEQQMDAEEAQFNHRVAVAEEREARDEARNEEAAREDRA